MPRGPERSAGPISDQIPFNRPQLTGAEQANIEAAVRNLYLSGNGPFSSRCSDFLRALVGSDRVLLTPSGTGALELASLLCGFGEGDEVIMPSFTFATSASSVALRGATPVFVDVDPETLNIDPDQIELALNSRTRAIMPVHYGAVGCEMERIAELADSADAVVVEDAAHAIGASWGGQPLGSFGGLGTLSFHETKNITCGEGGALLINDPGMVEAAEILQEKGTNRSAFFRGEVDKYTWVDVGSSFLLSDLNAAFLWAQLQNLEQINADRRRTWDRYFEAFADLETSGLARRPIVPPQAQHNGHLFYLLLDASIDREAVMRHARAAGVHTVFHYVPLHSSPAGRRVGRSVGSLKVTDSISDRLLRLPLWCGMDAGTVDRVVVAIGDAIQAARIPSRERHLAR